MLTQALLKELFHYNPETGLFTRLLDVSYSARRGDIAGSVNSPGYIQIQINRKVYRAHRLIWLYVHGVSPDQIDHINGVRWDNRLANLRNVTFRENQKNKKMHSNNTSGVNGVCWSKRAGKWLARISTDRKRDHLGFFSDKFEAICARKSAEVRSGYHDNHGRRC